MSVNKQVQRRGTENRKGSHCPVVEPGKLRSGDEWEAFIRVKTFRMPGGRPGWNRLKR